MDRELNQQLRDADAKLRQKEKECEKAAHDLEVLKNSTRADLMSTQRQLQSDLDRSTQEVKDREIMARRKYD